MFFMLQKSKRVKVICYWVVLLLTFCKEKKNCIFVEKIQKGLVSPLSVKIRPVWLFDTTWTDMYTNETSIYCINQVLI